MLDFDAKVEKYPRPTSARLDVSASWPDGRARLVTVYRPDAKAEPAPASALTPLRHLQPLSDLPAFVKRYGTLDVADDGCPRGVRILSEIETATTDGPLGAVAGRNIELAEWYAYYAALVDATVRLAKSTAYGDHPTAPADERRLFDHLLGATPWYQPERHQDRNRWVSVAQDEQAQAAAWAELRAEWQKLKLGAGATAGGDGFTGRPFAVQMAINKQGSKSARRMLVETVVNWWIDVGGVRPRFVWPVRHRSGVMWTTSLWGAIGAELFYAVLRPSEQLCVICKRPVAPPRRKLCGRAACERERIRRAVRETRAQDPACLAAARDQAQNGRR